MGGGCICCADEQSLGDAVTTLAGNGRVRALVVETSGLADPAATIELLHDPALAKRVRLQGVITLVDAEAVARPGLDGMDAGLWRAQIRFANWLLLSKCDRLAPEEVARVETAVRRVNPHARVFRLPECAPQLMTLLNANAANGELPLGLGRRRSGVRHAHQSYQTCGFQFPRAANRGALGRFLEKLDPAQIVRAKGFVRLRGFPPQWFAFHYVLGRHALEPYRGTEAPKPVGVFIGPRINADRILRRLDRVFAPRRQGSRRKSNPPDGND
jgi:G3E family GTPase